MNETKKVIQKAIIGGTVSAVFSSIVFAAAFYVFVRVTFATLDLRVSATETGLINIETNTARKEDFQLLREDVLRLESKLDRHFEQGGAK